MKTKPINIIIFLYTCLCVSCSKSDILNEKPQSSLAVPSTLADLQSMMEQNLVMNRTPATDVCTDNFYMKSTLYNSLTPQIQNLYTWQADIYQDMTGISDWNLPYQQIFIANLVLEGLANIPVTPDNQSAWGSTKGSALFYRAFAFYNLAQLFTTAYDSTTANTDLGLPLRLSSDINKPSVRSSIRETYNQIFLDLTEARNFLIPTLPINNQNRPSLPAYYALCAKIYLSMRSYQKAGLYADSCLKVYSSLNDLNTTKTSTSWYLPYTFLNNQEVIFNASQVSSTGPNANLTQYLTFVSDEISIDTNLTSSYSVNDLRKGIYFYKWPNGAFALNGSYGGVTTPFSGLATNEVLLIRAEVAARSGNLSGALSDLNTLLSKRYKTGTYIPISASQSTILPIVLAERNKELPFSNVRWTDIRRLNKEGYMITLRRIVNSTNYTLPPNDLKYAFPIPPDVIRLGGIQQNPR